MSLTKSNMFLHFLMAAVGLSSIMGLSLKRDHVHAATISSGNPRGCTHPTSYFRQRIDHNHALEAANNTFRQQYQLISDHFKPGGPILFVQGDEAPLSCIEGFAVYDYARQLGALLVTIEHRYFGTSNPYGLNSTESNKWTVQDMKPLTLDNILADSVALLRWLRRNTHGAEHSKIIVFGGSYGGFLAPLLKMRYPDVFHGVVASGGVFKLDTSTGPNAPVSYADWVSNVYADLSFEAAGIIRSGFDEVRSLMACGAFHTLETALNLCTRPSSSNQTSMLTYAIFGAYKSNSQFAQVAPVLGLPAHSLQSLINQTLAAQSPLAALNASIAASLKFTSGPPCLAWYSGDDVANQSDNVAESRPYSYMVCTFYAYPHLTFAKDTIFGVVSEQGEHMPTGQNINDYECKQLFNMSAKTGDKAYQEVLGLSQHQLMKEKRMFFVEAQYDWVSTLGVDSWAASGNRNKSRWWFMAEASHTEDLVRATEYDSQPLLDTRAAELSYIMAWLGM